MSPDSRTLSNPRLNQQSLGRLMCGLGLSPGVRATVTRACRKISQASQPSTISAIFSPYNVGAAPTMQDLEQLLSDSDNQLRPVLTDEEALACWTFLSVRKAVPYGAAQTNRPTSRWEKKGGALHNYGGIRPTSQVPSRRWR